MIYQNCRGKWNFLHQRACRWFLLFKNVASDREYVDEWRTVGQSECNCDLMKDARVAKLVVSSIGAAYGYHA